MTRSRLRRRIILLALLPSAIGAAVILAGFCYLQNHQVALLEEQKFALAEHLTAMHSGELTTAGGFDKLSQALLAIDPVTRVTLYNTRGEPVANAGSPHIDGEQAFEPYLETGSRRWRDDTSYYMTVPLEGNGWVIIEMDRAPFSVLRHKIFIALLLMAAAVALAILFFGRRLLTAVTVPLERLSSGIEDFLNGRDEIPANIDKNSEFQDLANAITDLTKRHRVEVEAIQQHLEEQTQDLRESLETVEIQNIELDMARKSALHASRAKSEFLANASHELRTPLNGVLGFANLLLKTELSNQQTDYVATIEQSAQGLLTIINDILDISRLETGELILEYKPVPIYQIIEDVLKMHAPNAHEKNLRLVTLMDPHVPENLLGDPLRLKQVITNLISNAVKFSDKGNIIVRVNFLGETDNQIHLKISVTDEGIGLTEEQQDGLFETFNQVDMADNRLRGGTGLGLAIARGLVQRMHGDIGVESQSGRGATFWFTARLGLNNRESARPQQHMGLAGLHALVCDSNHIGRLEIKHLLANWGASCLEADHLDSVHRESSLDLEPLQIAIVDAQLGGNRFDQHALRECVEVLNNEFDLPVIVLALPNQCRILQSMLDKLQAVALPRPVSHHQLYRTICAQLGVSTAGLDAAEPGLPHRVPGRRSRILAVDDNAANLRLVTELLKGIGAYVETADSGDKALAMCAEADYDLVLMDIQMPGLDGLETTRRLRQAERPGRRVPIVALTAHAVNEQKTRLLLAGMDDYLSKPVNDLDLRHIMDRWVVKRSPAPAPSTSKPGEPTGARENAVFDLNAALERAGHKPTLAKEMFSMLLESLDADASAIAAAARQKEMDRLEEVVHKLYGGSCYCGVPALCHSAGRLQALLHQQRTHQQKLGQVQPAVEALLSAIEELKLWADEHDIDALFDET